MFGGVEIRFYASCMACIKITEMFRSTPPRFLNENHQKTPNPQVFNFPFFFNHPPSVLSDTGFQQRKDTDIRFEGTDNPRV